MTCRLCLVQAQATRNAPALHLLSVWLSAAQECKRLGIQGTNPASEILRLPTKLPQLLLSLHASHISNAQVCVLSFICSQVMIRTP